jgi:hypothetical protein
MRLAFGLLFVPLASGIAQSPAPAVVLSRRVEFWNPAWSPDGLRLVFESTLPGKSGVYVINRDGSGLRRLTPDSVESIQPGWSPDGRRIVYTSDLGGHDEIYVMNADGSNPTRLTNMRGGAWYQSSFSPDGRSITFQGRPDNAGTRDRVFIVGVDGSGLRLLSDSALGAEGPRWSADGRSVRFTQIPYPKQVWREMQEGDLRAAKAAARLVSARIDGSGTTPIEAPAPPAGPGIDLVPDDADRAPDGTRYAYAKLVDGFAGLYVYDVAAKSERLLAGGPGAGPLGYLRTATLTASTDTLDTSTSLRTGGPRTAGESYVRVVRRVGAARWELADQWLDSSGRTHTRQVVRTGDGTLATEIETVRAERDSASLLIAPTRITGWVVPQGGVARLLDGPPAGERYASAIVLSAIARSRPAEGAMFLAPTAGLFSANPLVPSVDTLRVVGRENIHVRGAPAVALVIERSSGTRFWVDESSGVQLAARGGAGPQRWWWHIRRGVQLPGS